MAWTQFWDMHSGGRAKLDPVDKVFIEAPMEQALGVFYARFDRNPRHITCDCCGEDYSISEHETLDEATEYHRKWGSANSLEDYVKLESVVVIPASSITDEELAARAPRPGRYVWIED